MGSRSDRFAGPTLRLSLKNPSILFALLGHRDCIGLVHFDDLDLFYIRERGWMPLRVTNSPNLAMTLRPLVAIEIVEEGLSCNDDFAFFLALGDNFGVLGEEKRRKKNADHNK